MEKPEKDRIIESVVKLSEELDSQNNVGKETLDSIAEWKKKLPKVKAQQQSANMCLGNKC
jgi:hypothetical protein